MKKIDLGQTISVLANLGVIAGIVFLAYELQQNNQALETQAMLERQSVRRDLLARRQDNPELASATVKALNGEPLSAEDIFLLQEESILRLVNYEIVAMQVFAGLLEPEAIQLEAWRFEYNQHVPQMKETWSSRKHLWPPEFVEWFDQNVANSSE